MNLSNAGTLKIPLQEAFSFGSCKHSIYSICKAHANHNIKNLVKTSQLSPKTFFSLNQFLLSILQHREDPLVLEKAGKKVRIDPR